MAERQCQPVKCRCGYTAEVEMMEGSHWVFCKRPDCWHGPVVSMRRDKAVKAWNKVMEKTDGNV